MDPVPVVATPTATIPGVAAPSGAQILAQAAEERLRLEEQAKDLLLQTTRRSEEINHLVLALSKAQGKIKAAERDSKNPFFKNKYASLASVWDACREALSENEIAVIQPISGHGKLTVVTTLLVHSSGQWIEERVVIFGRDDTAQAMAGAATYARRFSLAGMVGVAPEDDDGNEASQQKLPEGVKWDKGRTELQDTASQGRAGTLAPPPVQKEAPEKVPSPVSPSSSGTKSSPTEGSGALASPPGPVSMVPMVRMGAPVPLTPTVSQSQPLPQQAQPQQSPGVTVVPPPGLRPPTKAPGR